MFLGEGTGGGTGELEELEDDEVWEDCSGFGESVLGEFAACVLDGGFTANTDTSYGTLHTK